MMERKLSCSASSEHFERKLSRRFSVNDEVRKLSIT